MAKKTAIYGILTALCLVLSFVEHLISFDFIAPGIKIGLANSVALLLVYKGNVKGGFAVNITRILLSALLFSAPSTLLFSLSGGILSLVAVSCFAKISIFSVIGVSIIGAAVHNIAQLVCASLLLGGGVWYYTPILLISAVICGFATGLIAKLAFNKLNFINSIL